jgi:hypothetical protein
VVTGGPRSVTLALLLASGAGAPLLAACKPDLNETVSLITGTQVLGVQASPAEGAPSGSVTFAALVVAPDGPVANAPITWDFCNARNPLANLGPVSSECLDPTDANLVPIATGPQASGDIPDIACRQFGPEVPVVMGNATPGRPVDPDSTGGYYQPVSLFIPTASGRVTALYGTRISCGLASGTSDQVNDYLARYHLNVNPAVASLVDLASGGARLTADGAGASSVVSAGQRLKLEVAWTACPLTDTCGDGVCGADESLASCPADCIMPQGCSGAERYVSFDLMSQALVDAREGIHVSWFATGGSFGLDRTGNDGTDTTTTSDNSWQAPAQTGMVHLWVVLHDDRAGIGWGAYTVTVQ